MDCDQEWKLWVTARVLMAKTEMSMPANVYAALRGSTGAPSAEYKGCHTLASTAEVSTSSPAAPLHMESDDGPFGNCVQGAAAGEGMRAQAPIAISLGKVQQPHFVER